MQTAKIFMNGQSQAVRLPKEFRFNGKEVFIKKVGNMVILIPQDKVWDTFLEGLNSFSPDCFSSPRVQPSLEKREELD
jgi:antitoxin VapB